MNRTRIAGTMCRAFLTTLLAIGALSAAAQPSKWIIAETIDRGDYFYIPASALADSVRVIVYQDKTMQKAKQNKNPIELTWVTGCVDGYYNLVITPEQIFLCTAHDNPNPSRLYWAMDIDSIQYTQIRKGLKQQPPAGFENQSRSYTSYMRYWDVKYKDTFTLPQDDWTDADLKRHGAFCKLEMKTQLKKFFAVLNTYLDAGKKLAIPDEASIKKIKPKYWGRSRKDALESINDWTQ
ncbi:MAG TPA: hypothetical protein VD993_06980 [Chitinophagaceae bacterium]|nr:hypothetical protein [Chitinophagaceae bacterium]